MPELRKSFSAARMNKDLDERLVPSGEYRDATNIEISTSEGSNSGVVQTLLGNTKKDTMFTPSIYPQATTVVDGYYDLTTLASNSAECVGSIASRDRDKIYYFVHRHQVITPTTITNHAQHKDYIVEYDTVSETLKYVFVDISKVTSTVASYSSTTTFNLTLGSGNTVNQTGVRIGMKVIAGTLVTDADNVRVADISYNSGYWQITTDKVIPNIGAQTVEFVAEPVLNFSRNNIITGINLVDDFLFWTDNKSEPKKINIPKSIAGTGGTAYLNGAGNGGINGTNNNATNDIFQGENAYFHTRLVKPGGQGFGMSGLEVVTNAAGNKAVYVEESHVTVIKRSPVTSLDLDMYRTSVSRVKPSTGEENPVTATGTATFIYDADSSTFEGDFSEQEFDLILDEPADFRPGDVLLFASTSTSLIDLEENFEEDRRDVRAVVTQVPVLDSYPENIFAGTTLAPYRVQVLSIKEGVTANDTQWVVRLEDKDTLFNFKFPRFSYRYKYQDGEYSTFAPWSEVAFLPDFFDYQPKKGYNLGMENQLRGLRIKNYFPEEDALLQDVAAIDILYKETNNPTVYSVKTITLVDKHPMWPDLSTSPNARGEFDLTTDMIHEVVPSNQLIRPWDNVPRKALAQELTANRIVYGNYLQNYTVEEAPIINLGVYSNDVDYGDGEYPLPSVKTMRDYQVGVVFSDRYGRETPVLTNKNTTIRIPKGNSSQRNRIKASIDSQSVIPEWAEYYSYYIKETSVEYYTLSQDRWYNAADGNIWLSFPSSERNKIGDDEFLVLKKAHGNDEAVYEKAKYKILAVENEAPDHIKTRRISLGKLFANDVDGSSNIGTAGFGFPLPGYTKVSCEYSAFVNIYGDQLQIERPKNLHLRVWQGSLNRSKFYAVTNISTNQEGTLPVTITVEDAFGEDVAFASTDGSVAGIVDGIAIELIEFRVVNSPEFDGRFFVKIFKDDVLESYVAQMQEDDWYIANAWNIGYINNNAYVNAGLWNSGSTNSTFVPPGYAGVIPEVAVHPCGIMNDGSGSIYFDDDADETNIFNWTTWLFGGNLNGTSPSNLSSATFTARNHPTEHDWSFLAGYNAADYDTGAPYLFDIGASWANDQVAVDSIRALNGSKYTQYVQTNGAPLQGETNPNQYGGDGSQNPNWDSFNADEPAIPLGNWTQVFASYASNVVADDTFGGLGMVDYMSTWAYHSSWYHGAKQFWQDRVRKKFNFFIDACSAYSWTGGRQAAPGNRYTSHMLSVDQTMGTDPVTGETDFTFEMSFTAGDYEYNGYPWNDLANGSSFAVDLVNNFGVNDGDIDVYYVNDAFHQGKCNFHPFLDEWYNEYFPESNGVFSSSWNASTDPNWYIGYATGLKSHPDYASAFIPTGWVADTASNIPEIFSNADEYFDKWKGHHKGTPSRGIWHPSGWEGSAIDLSWCSWSDDDGLPTANEANTGTLCHTLQQEFDFNSGSIQGQAWTFMDQLTTPGTQFRFRNDPDAQIYTVYPYVSPYVNEGYNNTSLYTNGTTIKDGAWGIRNVLTHNNSSGGYNLADYNHWNESHGGSAYQYQNWNRRQRWTILVKPRIGDTPLGYNPIHGTDPDAVNNTEGEAGVIGVNDPNWRRALKHDNSDHDVIEILSPFSIFGSNYSNNPGVWETEPKEAAELDIYYQASNIIPVNLTKKNKEAYIPIGSKFIQPQAIEITYANETDEANQINPIPVIVGSKEHTVTNWSQLGVTLDTGISYNSGVELVLDILNGASLPSAVYPAGTQLTFHLPNNACITGVVSEDVNAGDTFINLEGTEIVYQETKLGWNNCWCFGNGVESDRVRDDFNAPQMDNGVKASATIDGSKVREEHRKYGMIWSGIYNSISGTNETNQFIAGENITKEINPSNGSIQALKTKDTRIIMFCEDKVLRADTNKDLLFNADGNSQVVASNKVIGSAVAYQGNFGIAKNPESLAVTPGNMFFTDVMRGQVLALNDNEGLRSISELGMKDYFADNMSSYIDKAIGSYDERKNEYNISLGKKYNHLDSHYHEQITASYSERSKGWVSFKTFYTDATPTGSSINYIKGLEGGVSLNNQYYTFFDGHIWQHHNNTTRNNFYGTQNSSDVTTLFNDAPDAIKSFNTINYEGSQAKITNFDTETFSGYYNNTTTNNGFQAGITTITDGQYHNLEADIAGWSVDNITTNLQSCGNLEFKDKEGKWFAYPTGDTTSLTNLDEKEFSVQGLGMATMSHDSPSFAHPIKVVVRDSSTNAAGNVTWD